MSQNSRPLKYQEIAEKAMQENGVNNPTEIVCGLLWLLRDLDVDANALGGGVHSEGRTISLAKLLRDEAATIVARSGQLAVLRRAQGDEEQAEWHALKASRISCLLEMVDELMDHWEKEGSDLKKKGFRPVVS